MADCRDWVSWMVDLDIPSCTAGRATVLVPKSLFILETFQNEDPNPQTGPELCLPCHPHSPEEAWCRGAKVTGGSLVSQLREPAWEKGLNLKHMKRCSISGIRRKMHIETAVRYHLKKNLSDKENPQVDTLFSWWGWVERDTLNLAGGMSYWYKPRGRWFNSICQNYNHI